MFQVSDLLNDSRFQDLDTCEQFLILTELFAEQAKSYGSHLQAHSEGGKKKLLCLPLEKQKEILRNFVIYYGVLESVTAGKFFEQSRKPNYPNQYVTDRG